jgi:gamma-glutamyl-gamma-aminobutyrate hydrolase PuuD
VASNGYDNRSARDGRRPLIGLTTYVEKAACLVWDTDFALLHKVYVDMVVAAGGVPVLLPPVLVGAEEIVGALDGLVFTGGSDIDPAGYGERPHETTVSRPLRDEAEFQLVHRALERDLPVLGVCRGLQLINVEALGHSKHAPSPGIFGSNRVRLADGSRVAAIVGTEATVRCHHHQAVDRVAQGLEVVGWSEDGTVEAVELTGPRFGLAVQWHPEQDATDMRLFAAIVEAARAEAPRVEVPVAP